MSLFHFFNIADMIRRQGSEPIMVCCHYHNKKRSNPSYYIIEQEIIVTENIVKTRDVSYLKN